ncbi:ComEC/Rec2 family competence protein [Acetobacter lambici]|uniref:ComEC family competence protein n=1 Tax=Acetobacter lambici TaxID=1332824 RepID=A0ABT1EWU5_9PROT|nr:ComEC/Rec2 family competence protein [Acetobacter lambici]MCP1241961.1 ComEC family competence protein [Acetobacter lambici]MCP1257420.1 ComEC family competence protein [Acetobacter lambici]
MLNPMSVMVLFEGEHRRLVLWVPVMLALGALAYFLWPCEPGWGVGVVLPAVVAGLCLGACFCWPHSLLARLPGGVGVALAVGFGVAWLAAHRQPPMPELPRRGTEVTGIVRDIAYFPAPMEQGGLMRRITLAQAVLHDFVDDGMQPLRRTLDIRLVPQDSVALLPGDGVRVRAVLQPPPFPALPGGRDRQFEAWFSGRAGSGYAQEPVLVESGPQPSAFGASQVLDTLRERVDARIRHVLPGASGAVVATVLDGRAEAVPQSVREDFAASGLAHLLAVAGLHLGIVMGAAMLVCRMVLATWEYAALRWPCKAVSAFVAWVVGGGYVLLTGVHLPAERSWLMSSIVVFGLMVGRRAVSMRGLALAATLMLLVAPQVVLDVAFQMSMAAVIALVAGYEVLHPRLLRGLSGLAGVRQTLVRHGLMLVLTSLLAGTATLPVVMAHFGVVQPFFVLANLVAVPLMALWIMPLGLIALLAMPLHADGPFLHLMNGGVRIVLWLAHCVAGWPGARIVVPAMPGWGLGAVLLGLCWLCLWRGAWRWWGMPVVLLGTITPWLMTQPDILISPDGQLMGVRDAATLRVMGHARDERVVKAAWAQATALPVSDFPAKGVAGAETADGSLICGEGEVAGTCALLRHGQEVVLRIHDSSDGRAALPNNVCAQAAAVVSVAPLRESCLDVPVRLDRFTAWRGGAQAVFLAHGVRVTSDRQRRGERVWVLKPGGHGMPTLPLAQAE